MAAVEPHSNSNEKDNSGADESSRDVLSADSLSDEGSDEYVEGLLQREELARGPR